MEVLSVPRIIISGSSDGAGKSMLGLGLVIELRRRNLSISCATLNTSFVQSTLYRRLSGRYCRCLDDHLLSTGQALNSLFQAGTGADLVLIEGAGGLYDGDGPGTLRGSDAEFAHLTKCGVVLVISADGFGGSIAAMVKGYTECARGFPICGTIFNRIEVGDHPDVRDRAFYDAALDLFKLPPSLGAIPELNLGTSVPEDLISQEKSRVALPRQFFVDLGQAVRNFVDIDGLLARAQEVPAVKLEDAENHPSNRRTRIAVADDSCFSLGYQDNLELLRYFGGEVVGFSPLADSELPKRIGGLYLSGGYVLEYGEELSHNQAMRDSIRAFISSGGVVYSEGAGTALLCEQFSSAEPGRQIPGYGVIPAHAAYKPPVFSYVDSLTVEDSILGRPGLILKGIDSGEWTPLETGTSEKSIRISREGAAGVLEGFSPSAQSVCTFAFHHFGSNPAIAKNLVDACEVVEKI